jgi:esterase/lipase superfamily enzyme
MALTGALSGCAANALDRMGDVMPSMPSMPSMSSMPSMPDMPSMSNLLGRKPPKDPVEVPIFVASTRSTPAKANIRRAGTEGSANFSMLNVSVPPNHSPGSIELPSFGRPDKRSHFVLADERSLSRDDLTRQIATQLAGRVGSSRDILVFVHGYNTGAEDARRRLAQIVADSHFTGLPVLFNWPTRGELAGYVSDKDSATASRDALSRLFVDLSHPGNCIISFVPWIGRRNYQNTLWSCHDFVFYDAIGLVERNEKVLSVVFKNSQANASSSSSTVESAFSPDPKLSRA